MTHKQTPVSHDRFQPDFDRRDARVEKKQRQTEAHAADGIANGIVEIPGPIPQGDEEEIRSVAAAVERRERVHDPAARILSIEPFEEGLAIETESEKLAQHIADAIAKSRKAEIERAWDDEGKRRILTLKLRR